MTPLVGVCTLYDLRPSLNHPAEAYTERQKHVVVRLTDEQATAWWSAMYGYAAGYRGEINPFEKCKQIYMLRAYLDGVPLVDIEIKRKR